MRGRAYEKVHFLRVRPAGVLRNRGGVRNGCAGSVIECGGRRRASTVGESPEIAVAGRVNRGDGDGNRGNLGITAAAGRISTLRGQVACAICINRKSRAACYRTCESADAGTGIDQTTWLDRGVHQFCQRPLGPNERR